MFCSLVFSYNLRNWSLSLRRTVSMMFSTVQHNRLYFSIYLQEMKIVRCWKFSLLLSPVVILIVIFVSFFHQARLVRNCPCPSNRVAISACQLWRFIWQGSNLGSTAFISIFAIFFLSFIGVNSFPTFSLISICFSCLTWFKFWGLTCVFINLPFTTYFIVSPLNRNYFACDRAVTTSCFCLKWYDLLRHDNCWRFFHFFSGVFCISYSFFLLRYQRESRSGETVQVSFQRHVLSPTTKNFPFMPKLIVLSLPDCLRTISPFWAPPAVPICVTSRVPQMQRLIDFTRGKPWLDFRFFVNLRTQLLSILFTAIPWIFKYDNSIRTLEYVALFVSARSWFEPTLICYY